MAARTMAAKKAATKKPAAKKAAKPKKLTQEQAKAKVVQGLIEGRSLVKLCEPAVMPDRVTVMRWMMSDDAFATECARAREMAYEEAVNECLEIADGFEEADQKKVRISTRQWFATKLLPKKYGDRVDVNHGVQDSLAEKLRLARERSGK